MIMMKMERCKMPQNRQVFAYNGNCFRVSLKFFVVQHAEERMLNLVFGVETKRIKENAHHID